MYIVDPWPYVCIVDNLAVAIISAKNARQLDMYTANETVKGRALVKYSVCQ